MSCCRTFEIYHHRNDLWNDSGIISSNLWEEIWQAFSDGGELKYIDDPRLLAELAHAYHIIRSVKNLADKIYQERASVKEIIPPNYLNKVFEDLSFLITSGEEYLEDTVGTINEVLKDPLKPLSDNTPKLWK